MNIHIPRLCTSVLLLMLGAALILGGCRGGDNFDPFADLIFGGVGFGGHGRQTIHLNILDAGGEEIIARGAAAIVEEEFRFNLPGALAQEQPYILEYFIADTPFSISENVGVCQSSTTDHQWQVVIPGSSRFRNPIVVEVAHDLDFTIFCPGFGN